MGHYNGIEFIPKVEVTDKDSLALVYTPGVGAACLEIKNNPETSYDYTNRENMVGVFAYDYEQALQRAMFLKSAINVDACPFEIPKVSVEKLKFILENLEPSFGAFDVTLLDEDSKNTKFNVGIPVLTGVVEDLQKFFLCVSKNVFLQDMSKLTGSTNERALTLRKMAGGVIETKLTIEPHRKPIAIISDGTAVLGLGNIGAEAGMPVMEGKAVLFKSLGGVSAMPLCVRTQDPDEIVELTLLLEKSFSGVNLEDIAAPKCFDIEKRLVEAANIPIFHDDQHGTAVVVLAALLNALILAEKQLEDIKIVFSGAGAAACAVAKLLLTTGAKNVIMTNRDGIVYKGRPSNSPALEEMAAITNLQGLKGTLTDAMDGADVFIGLSAAGLLQPEHVKSMNAKPIIFALANPTPEIMPDVAKESGAFIVATGRSDFNNQVNNSLVFPGLFKALEVHGIKKITNEMKIKSAFAIASLVADDELSTDYIIVDALNHLAPDAIVAALASDGL